MVLLPFLLNDSIIISLEPGFALTIYVARSVISNNLTALITTISQGICYDTCINDPISNF